MRCFLAVHRLPILLTPPRVSSASPQHPGHRHPVQRDHHPADDVQHLRVPGGPGVPAAAEVQSSAGRLGSLPDPQHLLPLLGDGTSSLRCITPDTFLTRVRLKSGVNIHKKSLDLCVFPSSRTSAGSIQTVLFGPTVCKLSLFSREHVRDESTS